MNSTRCFSIFACVTVITFSGSIPGVSQSTPQGTKNQNVTTNNGTMFQFNINVTPEVTRTLKQRAKIESGNEDGWLSLLTPANDPDIPNKCSLPGNSITVALGGGIVGTCSEDRPTCGIVADSKRDADTPYLVSVSKVGSAFRLQAVVFDEEGKLLAKIEDNKPHINTKRAFEWKRPDAHTLDVVDERNREVLHVRFSNKKTFYITGLLYDSRGNQAKINKEQIDLIPAHQNFVSASYKNGCGSNAGRSVFAF